MLKLRGKSNCDYLSFDDIFGKEINGCEESPQPSICYNWKCPRNTHVKTSYVFLFHKHSLGRELETALPVSLFSILCNMMGRNDEANMYGGINSSWITLEKEFEASNWTCTGAMYKYSWNMKKNCYCFALNYWWQKSSTVIVVINNSN